MTMDLQSIQWPLVWTIFLARAVVFFGTVILSLSFSKGRQVGVTGMVALFLTNSHDIAIAYPACESAALF